MRIHSRRSPCSWRVMAAFAGLFFALALGEARAQSIDIGGQSSTGNLVDVAINVKVDEMKNHAPAGLMVQLYSPGNYSMQGGQQTDGSGRVEFHMTSGEYQVTVSGPGIEQYDGTIQIMRIQSRTVENIVVKSKPVGGQSGPPGSGDSISASKSKIPEKAAKEFQAATKALDQKDYAEAKKRFSSATVLYADYAVAYNGLGVAQMATGDGPGAQASFQKAVQIDDRFAEAYRNLARLALADHKFDQVDDLLNKSLQTEPLNAWALTYAAYAELQTQKFDQAITHARAAHSVAHPGLASVHIVAAHAFEATNQPDEAMKEYKLYLEEDPTGRDAARAKQAIASASNAQPK